MPKSAQKRSSEPGKEGKSSNFASNHNYDGGMDCNVQMENKEEFPPLPVTPSKPPLPKKPALSRVNIDNNLNSENAVHTLASLINSRSDAIEKMVEAVRVKMKDMTEKIVGIEKRVEKSEETAMKCLNRVSDLERVHVRRENQLTL
ncbi:hypothetical protein ABVT39_007048 [Epinephelus coioides]